MKNFAPIKYFMLLLLSFWLLPKGKTQLQCENDTSYLRSLIDLKVSTYLGYQGGLYPDGSNVMPPAHFSAGMNISRQVVPLNEFGELDVENGQAGFICLGASTAGNAFNHFKTKAQSDPTINPCLKFVNCAVGAKGLEIMMDTVLYNWYWDDDVMPELVDAELSRHQVQVIWLMVTSRVDTVLIWPYQPREVAVKYETLMPVLLAKFPNLKQVFLSGFNYGGYADPTKEFYDMINEPSSYWNNWSVKFLIEDQIEGDTNLIYSGPDRNSAWLAWGPHLWADGMRPNAEDGLRWNCAVDYKPDGGGYHMSLEGKGKEGKLIYDFFKYSPLTNDWFNYLPRWTSCDPAFRQTDEATATTEIGVFPNPITDVLFIEMEHLNAQNAEIQVFNSTGQFVAGKQSAVENGFLFTEISVNNQPAGLYHVVVSTATTQYNKSIVISR